MGLDSQTGGNLKHFLSWVQFKEKPFAMMMVAMHVKCLFGDQNTEYLCHSLVGKSTQNCAEFHNYSNSGPFFCLNFDWNFVFRIVKLVPAESEQVPAILVFYPTNNVLDFMHWKRFLPLIIFPAKITSTCFASQSK
jgi:hypothetical protein